MSAAGNLAAWQLEPKCPIMVKEADLWEPGPGEIRVKIMAAPLQPVDAKQFYTQIMPKFKYPGILGAQCAGFVDKLGEGVTKVQVGDRIATELNNYANGGDPARGALQRYAVAEEYEVVNLGPDVPFLEAASVNTQTPAAALFKVLGLDRPDPEPPAKPTPKAKQILIWGGSSAMGALSICYAKLAGYEVITTCSRKNFDLAKERGADHVFDRNDPAVADQIIPLLPIDFWFDTISLPSSISPIIKIAQAQHDQTGHEINLLTLLPASPQFSPGMPEIPPFLHAQMHLFRNKAPENQEHMQWLMGTRHKPGFLQKAIQGGWLKGVPSQSIGGLEGVEEGLKTIHEDKHSGVKLVVEPWQR